jgi:hypothetical protein
MKDLIAALLTRLGTIPEVKYLDEDWGQLDYYSPNFPVKWPCVLVDILNVPWKDQGNHLQDGIAQVSIHLASVRLSNTNSKAPENQRIMAASIFDVLSSIQKKLHGWAPPDDITVGPLTRVVTRKVKRDDGVREFEVIYTCQLVDDDAKITYSPADPKPTLDLPVGKTKKITIQVDNI